MIDAQNVLVLRRAQKMHHSLVIFVISRDKLRVPALNVEIFTLIKKISDKNPVALRIGRNIIIEGFSI